MTRCACWRDQDDVGHRVVVRYELFGDGMASLLKSNIEETSSMIEMPCDDVMKF